MNKISNLYDFLKKTNKDEIIVLSSCVDGCWSENEFDAHAANFDIIRYIDENRVRLHLFPEVYKLTRRK